MTRTDDILNSQAYQKAKTQLLAFLEEKKKSMNGVVPAVGDTNLKDKYIDAIRKFNQARGRDLFFPYLATGFGNGPFVELADGSVKFDMITGIGINFFGHSHTAFIEEGVDAAFADVMQGNLQPGEDAPRLVGELVKIASQGESKLRHAWLTTCGTMANEIALKIIRQRRSPASRVFAFEDGFSGRSTAMQELTDNPKYREGQPTYGEVVHLPFFNEALGLESSVQQVLEKIRWHIERYPTQFAGITMELVQGEGGFRFAPKAFYERIFEEAKKHGLAIWIDEVQTFGRTGEYFAFQKFGLEKWVDVVTVGKMLQACATLYSHEYNPKPGLVAGTFSGSTVALKTAFRTLRLLEQEGHLGNEGRTAKLSALFRERLLRTQKKLPGKIGQVRVVGGMVAYEPSPGTLEHCKLVLTRLFDAGVVAFYCGHGPYLIRMLPPLGAMTEDHVNRVCDLIESTL